MSRTSTSRRTAFSAAILVSVIVPPVPGGYEAHAQVPERRQAAGQDFAAGWKNGMPVTLTGDVTVFLMEDPEHHRGTVMHVIRDERTGQSFELRFEKGAPGTLRSGARIRIAGRSVGSEIYVAACCDGTTSSNVQMLSEPAAGPSGDQRTLVMIADLLDATVSCSVENIQSTLFAPPTNVFDDNGTGLSVNAEHLASSYGKVSWSGQVRRSTLNIRSTDPCDLDQYSRTLDAQAAAAGIDVASYLRKLYVFPPMSQCPFVGASTLGGNPSSSFNFSCSTRGLYSHELGHALGMSHAAAYYNAYTAGRGEYDNLLNQYGDYSDSMGSSGGQLRGFNAPHREQMGWLPPSAAQLVTQSGQYTLSPLSMDPSAVPAPQALKIPLTDGGYYYLSYRGGQQFDRYSPTFATRVSVHRYGAPSDALSGFTFLYAALADGRTGEDTFHDPVNGITVRMLSGYGAAPGSGAVVDVALGASCIRATPVITVTPQGQSGSAGAQPTYTISLTNNDAPSCPAADFALGGSTPTGWTGSLSAETLTLIPGATGQATLVVTLAPSSPPATYTTVVTATDAAAGVHAASVNATYTILDTVPPSEPLNLTVTPLNKSKQVKLSWSASSDNVGVVSYLVSRNGSVIGRATTTTWTDSEWKPGASYTYSVAATDAAGNISGSYSSATITLSGGGKGR